VLGRAGEIIQMVEGMGAKILLRMTKNGEIWEKGVVLCMKDNSELSAVSLV